MEHARAHPSHKKQCYVHMVLSLSNVAVPSYSWDLKLALLTAAITRHTAVEEAHTAHERDSFRECGTVESDFIMAFQKFVEAGRIAYVAEGELEGKLVAIVNIIDSNRVLVDGPLTGVARQEISIKKLHLTRLGLKFPFTAPSRVIRKSWADNKIDEKWKNSSWAGRVQARATRANLSDFERFKLQKARRTRNKLRRNTYLSLLLNAKKKGGLVPPKSKYGRIKKVKKAAPKKK
ncbi:unnamed protein product [Allacma fusca]|uniref:Large ribosomal subunit protein eL14 domain-containing protein n=2 Tax=Allacma fusca TaxID=39272 RepID=A0A8J2PSQ3_9HEXA|nr:unnamed protein product [Allacma fusca]